LDLEGTGSALGLLAWQDRKARDHEQRTALVAHSTTAFARANLARAREAGKHPKEHGHEAMLAAVAQQLRLSVGELRRLVVESKVVHWRQCQMQQAAPYAGECMEASLAGEDSPLLVLAGDYFTEGNFHGSMRSARAAAAAVMSWLGGAAPVDDDVDRAAAQRAGHRGRGQGRAARRWAQKLPQDLGAGTSSGRMDLKPHAAASAEEDLGTEAAALREGQPLRRWRKPARGPAP